MPIRNHLLVSSNNHERVDFAPVTFSLKAGEGRGQCFAEEKGKVDAQATTAKCVKRYAMKEGLISERINEKMRRATSG